MKKVLNAWSVPADVGFPEMFKTLKQAGFDGVELNLDEEGQQVHSLSLNSKQEQLLEIRKLADEYEMEIPSISTSLSGRSGSNNPAVRGAQKRILMKQLECADILGATAVLSVPGGMDSGTGSGTDAKQTSLAEAAENSLVFYRGLKKEIESAGIAVGLENVWNGFFGSPFHMADFIDQIDSPQIGAYFDVGNVLAFSEPQAWIEILAHRIRRIHVKDYKRNHGVYSGGAWVNLLDGDVNWPAVMQGLHQIGYDSYLTAELAINPYKPAYLYLITSKVLEILFEL